LTLHLVETRVKSIFFKLEYAILPLHSVLSAVYGDDSPHFGF